MLSPLPDAHPRRIFMAVFRVSLPNEPLDDSTTLIVSCAQVACSDKKAAVPQASCRSAAFARVRWRRLCQRQLRRSRARSSVSAQYRTAGTNAPESAAVAAPHAAAQRQACPGSKFKSSPFSRTFVALHLFSIKNPL